MNIGTQAQTNPFRYSDSNKRYHTYDYAMKRRFGSKCIRIPLDLGLTCPNIDGRKGSGGCIYCSGRGSGDFAPSSVLPLAEQYQQAREALRGKWKTDRCIPYFQAHTNTYAPLSYLEQKVEEALALPDAVGLAIATRADCLPEAVVSYLARVAERTYLSVELGLQTIHDSTAKCINRCHTFREFEEGYQKLRAASSKIEIGVHLMFGLPGETLADSVESVKTLAAMKPNFVKLHLTYVLRGTLLGRMWEEGNYRPLTQEEYLEGVVEALEWLPSEIVVARLTGDAPAAALLAPGWSRRKKEFLNAVDRRLYEKGTWQGKRITSDHVR